MLTFVCCLFLIYISHFPFSKYLFAEKLGNCKYFNFKILLENSQWLATYKSDTEKQKGTYKKTGDVEVVRSILKTRTQIASK
jgi:hypothetical protein